MTMETTEEQTAPEVKRWGWSAKEACSPLSREVLRKWLARVEASHVEGDATLLFSELFSNALRYPTPDGLINTRWFRLEGFIRVEVDDASALEPVVSDPGPEAESGRGLILVHLLADNWGVRHRTFNDGHGNFLHGKTVWFELKT